MNLQDIVFGLKEIMSIKNFFKFNKLSLYIRNKTLKQNMSLFFYTFLDKKPLSILNFLPKLQNACKFGFNQQTRLQIKDREWTPLSH